MAASLPTTAPPIAATTTPPPPPTLPGWIDPNAEELGFSDQVLTGKYIYSSILKEYEMRNIAQQPLIDIDTGVGEVASGIATVVVVILVILALGIAAIIFGIVRSASKRRERIEREERELRDRREREERERRERMEREDRERRERLEREEAEIRRLKHGDGSSQEQ